MISIQPTKMPHALVFCAAWWFWTAKRTSAVALSQIDLRSFSASERGAPQTPLPQSAVWQSSGVRVVGAGVSKTGTTSLQLALKLLGYHPAHGEWAKMRAQAHFWDTWRESLDRSTGADLDRLLQSLLNSGKDTTLDVPLGFAYRELSVRYPESKIILTVHPRGPEAWIASLENWFRVAGSAVAPTGPYRWSGSSGERLTNELWVRELGCFLNGTFTAESRAHCVDGYRRWIANVRATVPAERLLEFNVSAGWSPLCQFLGLPTPDVPFPRAKVFE